MSNSPALQLIPVASIRPSPYQYRTQFDDAKQQQLFESMRANGMSTPILVRPISRPQTENGRPPIEKAYQLVSGERRWRAATELGWENIQAICEDMTDAEAAARVVTENEMRADTNIMEKAAGYKRLTQPPCSLTLEEIAKRYGLKAASSVKRIIDLLDQPEAIRDFLSCGKIGEAHARYLSQIKNLDVRTKIAKRAADEGWTVKTTEEKVAKLLAKAHKAPPKSRAKPSPSREYNYNGFHCALVGDEVVISGRNFKRGRELVRQFVSDYQVALQSFLRDIESAAAEQPTPNATQDGANPNDSSPVLTDAAASAAAARTAEIMKQAAEAAGLKDVVSEIARAQESGGSALADLITYFNKPRPR